MEIIDAQIHEGQQLRPWPLDKNSRLILNVEFAREAMDAIGVDIALINAREPFIEAAVKRYPDRFAGYGFAGAEIDDVATFVSGYRDRPGRLALRVKIGDWATGKVTPEFAGGALEPIFAAAERFNVPLFLFAGGHPAEVEQTARAYPDLTLIVDHLGLRQRPQTILAGDRWAQLADVNALAKYPNVSVKFCGGPVFSEQQYPFADVWLQLRTMVEAFGPDRLMWASDYTRMRMATRSTELAPRAEWLTSYLDSLCFIRDTSELSTTDKAALFGGTVRRILRWPVRQSV
jgi:L-fuconolactonase